MACQVQNARVQISTLAILLLPGIISCAGGQPKAPPPEVPFEFLWSDAQVIAVELDDELRLGTPIAQVTTASNAFLLDLQHADIKRIYFADKPNVSLVAGPGDQQGLFRRPVAMSALDSGQFVVFDQARELLSFRDSLGSVLREAYVTSGFLTGMLALPEQRRVVLSGDLRLREASTHDLHEFDYSGKWIRSYGNAVKPKSVWEQRFNTTFAARLGSEIVTVAMNSNSLRFHDRQTGKERTTKIAPGWFASPVWPKHALGQRMTSGDLRAWIRAQPRMIDGVFALGESHVLVRFAATRQNGQRYYYYAAITADGRTVFVTRETDALVLATQGDTAFWVTRDGNDARLGRGVLRARTTPHQYSSSATGSVRSQ